MTQEAQKAARLRVGDTVDELRLKFPAAFDRVNPKPLAVGVHAELKDAFPCKTTTELRKALKQWTWGIEYKRALAAPGAQRCALNGERLEPVSPEHQEKARKAVARYEKKRKRK